jgi:O-methyltransferase
VRPLRRLLGRPHGVAPTLPDDALLTGASAAERRILERVASHTMTNVPQLLALIDAVRYCAARAIPGAFAECGVWLGGSVLAMILTIQEHSLPEREIYLYDTFAGMTPPTEADTSSYERPALETWRGAESAGQQPWSGLFDPADFNVDAVRALLLDTGYPEELLRFVPGPVEETLPATAPEQLALLRLDTDWYGSTRHELEHLFPALAPGGVLIVDDYGHWDGARRAVDDYFTTQHAPVLLNRIDYTARIAIKH